MKLLLVIFAIVVGQFSYAGINLECKSQITGNFTVTTNTKGYNTFTSYDDEGKQIHKSSDAWPPQADVAHRWIDVTAVPHYCEKPNSFSVQVSEFGPIDWKSKIDQCYAYHPQRGFNFVVDAKTLKGKLNVSVGRLALIINPLAVITYGDPIPWDFTPILKVTLHGSQCPDYNEAAHADSKRVAITCREL